MDFPRAKNIRWFKDLHGNDTGNFDACVVPTVDQTSGAQRINMMYSTDVVMDLLIYAGVPPQQAFELIANLDFVTLHGPEALTDFEEAKRQEAE